ncbi:uncharacterized protein LY89DRAFT_687886 [Mollisia scopiformis]|uniref:Uncharacterized protein n=1 Tax=Mollisia scopiformis TaxID=149040 RepID=A0A194WYE5_MOLSC|nr:uncharacterized protein LY89DRAFT_687886 [Mollisia scopiformis]KUJ12988.1 hypothetical protein LY89DRAFT_687886 [Mollisia scopiformis]
MAQQGGTYRKPSRFTFETHFGAPRNDQKTDPVSEESESLVPKAETNIIPQPNSPSQARDPEDWELVANPDTEKDEHECVGGFSSSFDLKVGWGTRKVTLLSWYIKVGEPACRNAQRRKLERERQKEGKKESREAMNTPDHKELL